MLNRDESFARDIARIAEKNAAESTVAFRASEANVKREGKRESARQKNAQNGTRRQAATEH